MHYQTGENYCSFNYISIHNLEDCQAQQRQESPLCLAEGIPDNENAVDEIIKVLKTIYGTDEVLSVTSDSRDLEMKQRQVEL